MKKYSELSDEERREVERKIALAIESTKIYSDEPLTENDKNILENLIRDNLHLLDRMEK